MVAPIVLLAASLALPSLSHAPPRRHADTQSVAHLRLGAEQVELELVVDADEIMTVAGDEPPQGDDWTEEDVRAVEPAALAYLAKHWRLELDGARVEPRFDRFELVRAFDAMQQRDRTICVAYLFTFPSRPAPAAATLVTTLFDVLEPMHRHVVSVEPPDREPVTLDVEPGVTVRFTLPDVAPGAARRRALRRLASGLTFEATTPWLALFLVALLLAPLPRARTAASAACAVATAIGACMLVHRDVIAPAPWAAAAAAALSVAYVAAESRFAREVKLRLPTAALFGLVHGMTIGGSGAVRGAATTLDAASAIAGAVGGAAVAALAVAALVGLVRRHAASVGRVADLLLVGAGGVGTVVAAVRRR